MIVPNIFPQIGQFFFVFMCSPIQSEQNICPHFNFFGRFISSKQITQSSLPLLFSLLCSSGTWNIQFGKTAASELQLENTHLRICVPNEYSNLNAHLRSLIRVFVVSMKKLCTSGYPKCRSASNEYLQYILL